MASVDQLCLKRVPVTIKSQDREERKTNIKIAVEIHTTASPVHKKDLVVTLTDETDLFFLYSLKLTEEDFQSLKTQQGLLVDFGAFPQRFISFLELCIKEEHSDSPKFVLQLVSNGSSNTSTANLNVIETNPFKHLTHLTLKLLPGTDEDIKKYLAHCLKTLKEQNELLLQRLEHTEGDLSEQLRQAREALSKRTVELDALKSEWATRIASITAKHAEELNTEKEKVLQAQSDAQQRFEQEKRDMEERYQRIIRELETRSKQLDTTNKDLTEKKYKADATIHELHTRQSLLEEECNRAKHELQNIRRENASLDHDYHELEKELNQLRTKLAVYEQELKDKEDLERRLSDLLTSEKQQKKKHEEELDKKKRHISKLEGTVKTLSEEVIKGNEIIKKLQMDMKQYVAKLKLRTQVTTEQEKLLLEKNKEMEQIRKELEGTKRQLQQREDENQKLNRSLEDTMAKLEESKQLLKTNENVINWLNKQITETQLHSQRGHGMFEMASNSLVSSKAPPSTHNVSGPSSCYSGQNTLLSAASVHVSNHSALPQHNKQPLVHYNPGQNKTSSVPIPIAKSSPLTQAEHSKHSDMNASPLLQPSNQQHLQNTREPCLDAKYLQPHSSDVPIQSAGYQHRTITPSPIHISSQTITPTNRNHPDTKQTKVPLASAYFPGQNKVS